MAKDDFRCDMCGEYAPAHDPECYFGVNGKRRRAAAEASKPRGTEGAAVILKKR